MIVKEQDRWTLTVSLKLLVQMGIMIGGNGCGAVDA